MIFCRIKKTFEKFYKEDLKIDEHVMTFCRIHGYCVKPFTHINNADFRSDAKMIPFMYINLIL